MTQTAGGGYITAERDCDAARNARFAKSNGNFVAGRDIANIQREFPGLTTTDVAACLDYARDLAEFEAAPA